MAGGYHKDAGGDSDKRCDDESVKVDNRRRPTGIINSLLGFLFSQVFGEGSDHCSVLGLYWLGSCVIWLGPVSKHRVTTWFILSSSRLHHLLHVQVAYSKP
ncbi:hypothetical protein HanPSC8_Chr09g0374381 [Helianthus annuus]|nr:hypothetical protein HanPSC8_Chr09g0374381 [Helianthus annuus]